MLGVEGCGLVVNKKSKLLPNAFNSIPTKIPVFCKTIVKAIPITIKRQNCLKTTPPSPNVV